MGFNYAREKLRFEKKWQLIRQQYEQAGMSPEDIKQMYDFDWAWFKSQRKYFNHLSDLPDGITLESFPQGTAGYSMSIYAAYGTRNTSSINRYQWFDEIDDEELVRRLKMLSCEDIELLTCFVFDERTQSEIALKNNTYQKAVSRQIAQIRKILEKGV